MKWLAFLLLVANVLYLAWELERDTRAGVSGRLPALEIPADATELKKFDELSDSPTPRSTAAQSDSAQVLLPSAP